MRNLLAKIAQKPENQPLFFANIPHFLKLFIQSTQKNLLFSSFMQLFQKDDHFHPISFPENFSPPKDLIDLWKFVPLNQTKNFIDFFNLKHKISAQE